MRSAFALIVLCLLGHDHVAAQSTASGLQTDERPAKRPAHESADESAIRALVVEFTRAFNAGDAKAVAALFTDQARIATEGGKTVEGRSAVEKLFAASFEATPGQTIAVKTESLRLLGTEAALEEGTATITVPTTQDANADSRAETSRYSAAYVKKDGKWLQDSIHDYPMIDASAEKTAHDHLKELEWLVGEWMDEDDNAEVHTSCDWSDGRSYLLRNYKVKVQGRVESSGVHRIGWDPRFNQFRSWAFDSEGGFSEGLWSRDGDRWIIKTTGVLKDGRAVSATNVLTRLNRDALRWGSIDRTLGNNALPDAEDAVLVRRPPAPHGNGPSTQPARNPQ
ncbi:YybH family protein [Paludisphaera borealis]|uniref:DUF4440 domain-containing protein n=1 Tax=Paludisphaera borealis TaxID=1387353 RepID=A0A1U7CUY1_9BACT|nr:SgcJ/EcaC family oxidoreductase [Paludisphaera borealis]APW62706.1 hypothetical protein BSF38_04257 [Paludisphaera borealis]